MSAKSSKSIPPSIFWVASLLFFVSGGTGLVYQVVWFKRFSHVWGSSSLAFAAVGASFLFGLGVGAWLFGRFADRIAWPLRWYGLCELAIGLLALVIPFEIASLVNASVGLYARIPEQPLARYFVQFAITLLVVGPPCVLMGGTLPLLIRQLTARRGSLDEATGWLYAINTFGAAAGCYLTGFFYLPLFGLLWTNNAAAAVNIAIGIIASIVGSSAERNLPAPTKGLSEPPAEPWSWRLAGLYLAAALSGCAALMLEMTWSRQLALVVGGSTYGYSATLFVVLLGIALGSLLYHVALRYRASSPILPVVVMAVLAITTLAGKWSLPWLSVAVSPENIRELRGDAWGNALVCVLASFVLELLPAVAMGVLFPLFVHWTRAGAAHVGSAVGNIYAWNTFGSIAGASLTAVLLFPHIGTTGAVGLAVAMYLVALLAILPWQSFSGMLGGGAVAAVGAALVVLVAWPVDPRPTNMGYYIYGDPRPSSDSKTRRAESPEDMRTLFFREGASSNVLVSRRLSSALSLRVNGKVDAGTGADMENQLGLGYLPRLFNPDAREVIIIGFGSGSTSGAALAFPETRVTCCEIEPAVYEAAPQFAEVNHRPYEKSRAWLEARNTELPPDKRLSNEQLAAQARFSMIFGDGRTAVQGSSKKFDLIISEPSNPWIAGVSNLFTREFFRAASEHLNPGGVLAQWIQTYNFTISDYLMIVRTLRTEFKHFGVMFLSGGADTILLASNEPLLPDASKIAELQKVVDGNAEIRADFNRYFGGSDLRLLLLQYYQLGQPQLERLVDADTSQVLNTDMHVRLEFDAPLNLFRQLDPHTGAAYVLVISVDPKWLASLGNRLGMEFQSPDTQFRLAQSLLNQMKEPATAEHLNKLGQGDRALRHLDNVLKADPEHFEAKRLWARVKQTQNRRDEAAKIFAELVRRRPDDSAAHASLADELLLQKKTQEAVEHYRDALRLEKKVSPDNGTAMWANNLAWILATNRDAKIRNGAEAVEWARKACDSVDNKQPVILDTLASALAENGQFDEAIKVSKRVLELAADNPALVKTTHERIKLFESSQPYHEK